VDATTIYLLLGLLLPLLVTGTGVGLGVRKYRTWRQTNYLLAKREWSHRLLEADERVCLLEAATVDDAFATKRVELARVQLNNAFGIYSNQFAADHYKGVPAKAASLQLAQTLGEMDKHLAASATEPGSVDRLKLVGKDFGREFAQIAVAGSAKILEAGAASLNKFMANGLGAAGSEPVTQPRSVRYLPTTSAYSAPAFPPPDAPADLSNTADSGSDLELDYDAYATAEPEEDRKPRVYRMTFTA